MVRAPGEGKREREREEEVTKVAETRMESVKDRMDQREWKVEQCTVVGVDFDGIFTVGWDF